MKIDLPKTIEERLLRLSRESGRSADDHVLAAIAEYLDDMEDVALADQRLADLREGRSDTVSLEDVMRRYGVAN